MRQKASSQLAEEKSHTRNLAAIDSTSKSFDRHSKMNDMAKGQKFDRFTAFSSIIDRFSQLTDDSDREGSSMLFP